MPLVIDVDKPQQALLDSVVTSEELLTVLGQLNVLKGFVYANIHQNGPSNYQSSEKGRLQVKIVFLRASCYLFIKFCNVLFI
jgi:nuclear pore complex protein Nup155